MFFRILEFVKKEFIELRRDRKTLAALLAFPTVLLVVFTYAAKTDIEDLPVAVYDLDGTPASREFSDAFFETKYFRECEQYPKIQRLKRLIWQSEFPGKAELQELLSRTKYATRSRRFLSFEEVRESLDDEQCFAALVIPAGFGEKIEKASPEAAKAQLIIDGSIPATATQASAYGRMIAADHFSKSTFGDTNENVIMELSPLKLESRILYNPELDAILFMIPGLVGYILTFLTIMLSAMALIREREAGTFEQLQVTPLRGVEIIAGKLIPFGIISFVAVMIILMVSVWWFGLVIKGSLLVFVAGLVIFIVASLNLGFFISSVSTNQIQSGQLTIFYMLPSMILSGMYFPIFSMPKIFQYISYIIPLRYFLVIMRGVTLKGVGFGALWEDFLGIGIFLAVTSIMVSVRLARGGS